MGISCLYSPYLILVFPSSTELRKLPFSLMTKSLVDHSSACACCSTHAPPAICDGMTQGYPREASANAAANCTELAFLKLLADVKSAALLG